MRFLYKCRITSFQDSYSLNCKGNGKTETRVFRGSEESFIKFLKRVKAMDTMSSPKSVKNTTYKAMLDHGYFYIWSNMLPKTTIIEQSQKLFHCSPEKIDHIEKDKGVFNDCLFFSSTPHSLGSCKYLYSFKGSPSIVDVKSFFYKDNSDKLTFIIKQIENYFSIGEEDAQDLLDSTEESWKYSSDPEDNFYIQALQGEAGKVLGYDGVLSFDEQGAVYIIPMYGREKDLVLEKIRESLFFKSNKTAKEYLDEV